MKRATKKKVDYSKSPNRRGRRSDSSQAGNLQTYKDVVDTSVKILPDKNMHSDANDSAREEEIEKELDDDIIGKDLDEAVQNKKKKKQSKDKAEAEQADEVSKQLKARSLKRTRVKDSVSGIKGVRGVNTKNYDNHATNDVSLLVDDMLEETTFNSMISDENKEDDDYLYMGRKRAKYS